MSENNKNDNEGAKLFIDAYDKVNENDRLYAIFEDQKKFTDEVYEQYNDKEFSCYNFKQNNFDIWYSLMRAQSEINEAADLVPSKTWKYSDQEKPIDKQKILEEIVDAQKFLNQAIIRLGFNAIDIYEMHMKKSNVNRNRQKNNY